MAMRRWAFNFSSTLSLLICVATLALWPRSYFKGDALDRSRQVGDGHVTTNRIWLLQSNFGKLDFCKHSMAYHLRSYMEPAGTDKDDWSFGTGLPRKLMSVNHPEPKIPDVI